jgi:hypothetical protein
VRLFIGLHDQVNLEQLGTDRPQEGKRQKNGINESLCLRHCEILLEHLYQLWIIVSIALACYHAPENIQYGQKEVRPNPQHSIRFLYFFLYLLDNITNLEFDYGLHRMPFSKTEISERSLRKLSHFRP